MFHGLFVIGQCQMFHARFHPVKSLYLYRKIIYRTKFYYLSYEFLLSIVRVFLSCPIFFSVTVQKKSGSHAICRKLRIKSEIVRQQGAKKRGTKKNLRDGPELFEDVSAEFSGCKTIIPRKYIIH